MTKESLLRKIAENATLTGEAIEIFLSDNAEKLLALAEHTVSALQSGNKVLVFGNGGSAADAQHLAAEFVGRFLLERQPLPAMALTVDTSALTAISNDYGYDAVFARQVRAFAVEGDIAIGISTSGSSKNVCEALEAANELDAFTVALCGGNGGPVSDLADESFLTPTTYTPRVQECHISWIHAYCDLVELIWVDREGGA